MVADKVKKDAGSESKGGQGRTVPQDCGLADEISVRIITKRQNATRSGRVDCGALIARNFYPWWTEAI